MHQFVPDDALDYRHQAVLPPPGAAFTFDEPYRRAHLPLVAPAHQAVIREDASQGYSMGRHETVWSLVIPVPWAVLAANPAFVALDAVFRDGPLTEKISWQSFEARKSVLHATICGGLGSSLPPDMVAKWRAAAMHATPFAVELRGLFSGAINRGRLYLKLYPELRDGRNCVQASQSAFGRPETRLYVMGLYNLTEELTPPETQWLAARLAGLEDTLFARLTVDALWLLGARDDLALDSEVAEIIRLG